MRTFTSNGKPYDFKTVAANYRRVSARLPRALGGVAVNFFKDSFKRQGWLDKRTEKWPARKKSAKRNTGRAILIDRGRLRNSIILAKVSGNMAVVNAQAPYAAAHNEGFKGRVKVKAHERGVYSKYKAVSTNLETGKTRSRTMTYQSGSRKVRAHSRQMNLPRRQFMGDSEVMFKKMDVVVTRAVDQIFNN